MAEVTLSIDAVKANTKYKHPAMPARAPVFIHGDILKGKLAITPKGSTFEHRGVRVSLKGVYQDSDGAVLDTFFVKTLELLPPGVLSQALKCPYSFGRVALPFPTYIGKLMRIIYFVECEAGDVVARKRFYILRTSDIPEHSLKKSAGIENLIHLDIVIRSTVVDARQCFIGALYMTLSRIRMVKMNIELHRIEKVWYEGVCTLAGDDERLLKFEVMDGAPVRGTMIPMRIFLGGLKCWPSPKEPGCRITCEYFLKLRGVDEMGNSYVKKIPVEFSIEK